MKAIVDNTTWVRTLNEGWIKFNEFERFDLLQSLQGPSKGYVVAYHKRLGTTLIDTVDYDLPEAKEYLDSYFEE